MVVPDFLMKLMKLKKSGVVSEWNITAIRDHPGHFLAVVLDDVLPLIEHEFGYGPDAWNYDRDALNEAILARGGNLESTQLFANRESGAQSERRHCALIPVKFVRHST